MADSNYNVDPTLLAEFIDESEEALSSLDSLFVKLEAEPTNLDIIGSIFRPVHTVKGNSAFFGLLKVKVLSHEMETLLDLARKGQLTPDATIISILLKGVDRLKEMMLRARNSEPEIDDEEEFNELLNLVIAAREPQDESSIWKQMFERLDVLQGLVAPADSPAGQELDTLLQIARSLAPGVAAEPVAASGEQNGAVARIQEMLTKAKIDNLNDSDSAAVLKDLHALNEMVEGAEAEELVETALDEYSTLTATVGFDMLLADLLSEKIDTLVKIGAWKSTGEAPEEEPEADTEKPAAKKSPTQAKSPSKPAAEPKKTMRIPEESIDNFLGFVGELIVVGEMFGHLQKRLISQGSDHHTTAQFRQVNDTFNDLSNNLRESIMEIRKVTVRPILQKAPRMVRDIATKTGKQIAVVLEGEDTQIDKSLLDTLEAPLTHMVRNSADHGIEMPDVREASGKPAQGTVRIAVTENENEIYLTVTDDGKGLDYDAIRSKAVSIGLVPEGQEMTEEDVVDLLFASGVSTAKEVTDVSGRGVGMDVVKRNVESAGGKITVSSTAGQGSLFRIAMPKSVSTQIMEGFIVRFAGTFYVLPLDRIRESFRPTDSECSTVLDNGECVLRHDQLLPVISLAKIFGKPEPSTSGNDEDGIMIALESRKKRIALHVDDVLGVQQVVVKPMEGLSTTGEVVQGGAIMGDGTVAVVLDPDSLTRTVLV